MLVHNGVLLIAQIFLAICLLNGTLAEKMMRPVFKAPKYWSNEKYLTHQLSYDASDPHINMTMDLHQDLHDVDVNVQVQITNKLDSYYSSTFNVTLNFCRIIRYATTSPVGRFVHSFLREYGNIIETCPIVKRVYKLRRIPLQRKLQGKYSLNKIWWPEDSTIAMMPEIDFVIDFAAYHLDASKTRTLIINDHIPGEFVVQDVNNLKPGIFAMLPQVG